MSWTDVTTIRIHLQALGVDAIRVDYHPLRVEGGLAVQLPHASLAADSLRLYAQFQASPSGPITISFSGTGWVSAGMGAIHPQATVIAKSFRAGDRFIEGVDFAVDEMGGRLRRLEGGSIPTDTNLLAWYLPLTRFVEGVDYDIDLAAGLLKIDPEGAIPDPCWLLICYVTSEAGASDTLIGQVIGEAEAKIADRLKEGYDTSSGESGLQIGATELTLSMLCDDLALRSLNVVGDASADDRARQYLFLAKRYEERAIASLSRFLRLPLPSVSTRQPNTPMPAGW